MSILLSPQQSTLLSCTQNAPHVLHKRQRNQVTPHAVGIMRMRLPQRHRERMKKTKKTSNYIIPCVGAATHIHAAPMCFTPPAASVTISRHPHTTIRLSVAPIYRHLNAYAVSVRRGRPHLRCISSLPLPLPLSFHP